jgi:hypothetical protein
MKHLMLAKIHIKAMKLFIASLHRFIALLLHRFITSVLNRFSTLSLHRFIASSLYRFIALSLHRFIASSLLLPSFSRHKMTPPPWPSWRRSYLRFRIEKNRKYI